MPPSSDTTFHRDLRPIGFRVVDNPIIGKGELVVMDPEENRRFVDVIFARFGPRPDDHIDQRLFSVPSDIQ